MSGRCGIAALLVVLLWPRSVAAHDFRPGALTLKEQAPGRFQFRFVPPVESTGAPAAVTVSFPDGCTERDGRLDCGSAGLEGEIRLLGLSDRMRVVVSIAWRDGERLERVLDADDASVRLTAAMDGSAWAWLQVGAEHILLGPDHLAFVLGVLLLLGARLDRRLLFTITAFTAAHSLTLVLAVLDVVRLASAPVEATIAASVVLVAREATHDRPTVTRRAPWAVALLFGLVHGLGFAGALATLSLPEGSAGFALLWFNLGVELGQLLIVVVAVAAARATARLGMAPRLRRAACYAIGGLGAWWFIERLAPMVRAWS